MKLKNYLSALGVVCLFASCSKELSLELAQPLLTKEEEFKKLVTSTAFQLRACYSDIPVDYIEDDSVITKETNLWRYVSPYLKDDVNTFRTDNANVSIAQHTLKIPGNASEILDRQYHIGTDESGVYMDFLDFDYLPLKYRLHELGPDYFVLAVEWKYDATLYSRFETVAD